MENSEKDGNTLDGTPVERHLTLSWCVWCKHFHDNGKGCCEAYPEGIPDKFAVSYGFKLPEKHAKVEAGQIGDFVFTRQ